MNRRGFLFAAGAGLGATAISLPPSVRTRATGNVLPAAQTPDPAAWPDNNITLEWLGHATVLINFYGMVAGDSSQEERRERRVVRAADP
jgi:hypothetical protein